MPLANWQASPRPGFGRPGDPRRCGCESSGREEGTIGGKAMNNGKEPFRDSPIPDTREGFLERLRRDREMAPALYARRKELRDSGVVLSCPGLVGGIPGTECVAVNAGDRVEFRRLFEEENLVFAIAKENVADVCVSTTPRPSQIRRTFQALFRMGVGIMGRYPGWRKLARVSLGEGPDAFHVFFDDGPDLYLATARLAGLFAHPASAGPPTVPGSVRDRLRRIWCVTEGNLPDAEDETGKPRAGSPLPEAQERWPALTPKLLAYREQVRLSGVPLQWLPETAVLAVPCVAVEAGSQVEFRRLCAEERLLFSFPKSAIQEVAATGLPGPWFVMSLLYGFGLSALGRRCRRLVRVVLKLDAGSENVFFETPKGGELERSVSALAAICGRKSGHP